MSDEKRPIEVDDLYALQTVEDPQFSPDGRWIAFVRVQVDKMDNGYKRNIWLRAVEGDQLIQVTRGGKDSTPRWSPDGKWLAFVSGRAERPQIYLLPITAPGGEARAFTSLPNGAVFPAWSPDSQQIAFLSGLTAEERARDGEEQEPAKDKLEEKHRKERHDDDEKHRLDPYFMWRVPYRQGTSFSDGRYSQVYVMGLEDGSKPRRLTDLEADHQPPVWMPDGKSLLSGRQFDITQDEPFRQEVLIRIDVEAGESTIITGDDHTSFNPKPSPDGQWIAYGRLPRHNGGLTEAIPRLTVMPAAGGEARDLNLEFDRSVDDFAWTADSSSLIFKAGSYGDAPVHRVSVQGGAVETLASGRFMVRALNVSVRGDVAAVISTPANPSELYLLRAGQTLPEPVTEINKAFLDQVIVQEVHEMRFQNPHGQEIQGWYILPVGYEEGKQYPLALNIHGGPHVMWSPSESSMFHEWQLHAARGYAVFFCNPRGGDGYGEAFQRSLHAAWGDVAFEDIMAGVDAFLEKSIVDEKRMAVTGGSYGGYMTAWIVGHTDRFVSAVTQRGVYNLISFYGTSDVPSLISGEFDVEPWENHELLWKHSPLAYAQNIKTPLLIIHSENDYRVPIEQGEQLFAFVRRSGGTVEMWRFPRDGHELSRSGEPRHRVERLTKMVAWFDKYCMPAE
ncbi:MAG: S9 family peptidase [Anaerolineae bacterium]